MNYIMLDVLNGDRDDWLIKVRVCRMWESMNPNTEEQYSLDMILMDENVNKLTVSNICLFLLLL